MATATFTSAFDPDPITVHNWKVDSGSGDIIDREGTRDWALKNGPSWITGNQYVGGYAVEFDGGNDYAKQNSIIPTLADQSGDWAYEMWINLQNPSSRDVVLYLDGGGSGDNERQSVTVHNGEIGHNPVWASGSPESETYPSGLFHFVVTYDGSSMNTPHVFVNKTRGSHTGNVNFNFAGDRSNQSYFATYVGFYQHAPVILDRFRVFDRSLSTSEISDLYNSHPSI
jgi:hypothetical protein